MRGNPSAASVFAPDATVRPVVLGPGLLAEARTSGDDETHALCVQNVTDEPLTFIPITHLPPARDRDATVMFICGETETATTEDGDLVCKLPPRAFVWLGCSIDGTRSQQICR